MSTVNDSGSAPSAPDSVSPHVIKERYRVIQELSDGPMGKLYLADDLGTGTRVTVRMLGSQFASDEQFASALERHALRLAALCITSESVAKVCEFDRTGEAGLLIAMEHVAGKNLTEVIEAEGPLPVGRALHLGIQIARGLQAAHTLGLVHGGLTPDNIVITGTDDAKLMDFGLAELGSATATKRPDSAPAIGPEYLAPEQLEGGEITEKTDIYALGSVLYQMLCGAAPFTTIGPNVALAKQLYEVPALPGKSRGNVPGSVERMIRKTLTRQPDRRPDIAEVIQDLEREQDRLHKSRAWRHARAAALAVIDGVKNVAITVRQSSLEWKVVLGSCVLLIVLSVATAWIVKMVLVRTALSSSRSGTIQAPPPTPERAGATQPDSPAVAPTVSTSEPPITNPVPATSVAPPAAPDTAVAPPIAKPVPEAVVEPPIAKPAPETVVAPPITKSVPEAAVAPKKPVPLAVNEKRGTSRQAVGPPAPAREGGASQPTPARDKSTLEPASSDPSDPAGVIDWLLKESGKDR